MKLYSQLNNINDDDTCEMLFSHTHTNSRMTNDGVFYDNINDEVLIAILSSIIL